MRRFGWLLGMALVSLPALAGNIHFGLTRSGDRLQVTNHGDSTAFYPQVLRLGGDGRWLPLMAPGVGQTAAMAPGQQLTWQWRDAGPGEASKLADGALPLMVRFYDQAGTGFGQISWFQQPPVGGERVAATYRDGRLTLAAPAAREAGWRRSWLVWGHEDTIAALTGVREFSHTQPQVRLIDWAVESSAQVLDLGAAQPPAWLLHEIAQGLEMQVIARAGRPGREQRAAWLDAGTAFYGVAGLAGALAVLLGLIRVWRARRGQ